MRTWTDGWIAWATGKPRAWLAYKIGVSVTAVHFYFHGMRPYLKNRKRIERLSRGAVGAGLPKVVHGLTLNSNKSSRKRRARSVQNTTILPRRGGRAAA